MMMRSILVHIASDECLEARLQVALDIGRLFNGHVTCLQAGIYDLAVTADIYGLVAAEVIPELRKAADELREKIEKQLSVEDVAWTWIQEDGPAIDPLLARSGLSDLVVMGSRDPIRPAPSSLASEIILRARTPILLVPPGTKAFAAAGLAFVAWNGSPEACRALRAATPLLRKAERVILATAVESSGDRRFDLPAVEGAEYLSRHDIACEMIELPVEDRPVAEVLRSAAVAREAAYIVMGTYGHARLTEMIWGGVTRNMFSHPPAPILSCH